MTISFNDFMRFFPKCDRKIASKKLYESISNDAKYGLPSIYDHVLADIDAFYEDKDITFQHEKIKRKTRADEYDYMLALQEGILAKDQIALVFYWYHCIHFEYCEQIEKDVFGDTLENRVKQQARRTKPGGNKSGREAKPVKPVIPPKPRTRPYTHPVYAAKATVEEAERDIAQGGDSSLWLSPYNHFSIPLVGRDDEIETLNAFIKDGAQFLITYVIAPSGAGKTRLVSQWMRKFVDDPTDTEGDEQKIDGWDAGLVESRDDSVWKNWQPHCDTLIVIDYTYNYDAVIKAITDKGKESHGKRIRLLILDHIKPQKMGDDISYHMADDTNVRVGIKSVLVRSEYATITLSPDVHSRDLLSSVIARAASLFSDRPYDVNDAIIRDATDHLLSGGQTGGSIQDQQSDENNASANALRHPLFAALMGQTLGLNPDGDVTRLKRRDLVEQYFEPPQRIPWKEDEKNEFHETLGRWIGCYVSVATLLRRTELKRINAYLPQSFGETLKRPQAVKTIKQIAGRLVSQDVKDTLKPFEPDILGETFFLKFLMDHEDDDEARSALYQMLARFTNEIKEREAVSNFLETIQRLTRNLIYDDQSNEFIRDAWRHLSLFLDPEKFPEDSLMQKAFSIALLDVIGQCHKAGFENHVIERFAGHIVLIDLDDLSTGSFWKEIVFAGSAYFDWILHNQYLADDDENLVREILEKSIAQSEVGVTTLMVASQNGHVDVVKLLLAKKTDPNTQTTDDSATALLAAIASGHVEIVKLLLENNADPNQPIKGGVTALMVAIHNRDVESVKLLLEFKADLNQRTTKIGTTVLIDASYRGLASIVKLLLENKADPNKQTTDDSATALMLASENGHVDVVKLLLAKNADPNQPRKDGVTALMLASQNGHVDVVKLLLAKNADPNRQAKDGGSTALMVASQNGDVDVVKLLLAKNADPNKQQKDRVTALMVASQNGHVDVVKLLLAKNADPNKQAKDGGSTALMVASENGDVDVVKLLLAKNADPNKRTTDDSATALMLASQNGHVDVVKLLLAKNADPNRQAKDGGSTALMAASQNGHVDVVKLLLAKNADPNKQQKDRVTALMVASENGHVDVVKLLLAKNADPNQPNEDGITALILSAGDEYLEIISLLISSSRIQLDYQTSHGATALIYAAIFNKVESVKTLLLAGANPLIKANDGSTAADFVLRNAENQELHDLLKQAEADWIAKHGEPS